MEEGRIVCLGGSEGEGRAEKSWRRKRHGGKGGRCNRRCMQTQEMNPYNSHPSSSGTA